MLTGAGALEATSALISGSGEDFPLVEFEVEGVFALGRIGGVLIWLPVSPNQNPDWVNVDANQTPDWDNVAPVQNPDWTDVAA